MTYEIPVSRVERIEQRCNVYTRKWLGLPKMLATSALYGKMSPLQLPFASIVEEYKAGKVRTVMTLRYSKDMKIRENPPEVRTGRKWNAESRVDDALSQLEHRDIIGSVQTNREGLGMRGFKSFSTKDGREKRMTVVNERRKICQFGTK